MDNKEFVRECGPVLEKGEALINRDKPEFVFYPLVWSENITIVGRQVGIMVRRYQADVFGWTVIGDDGFFDDGFSMGGTSETLDEAFSDSVERAEYFLKNY